jgi:hypothetical protein
MASGLKMMVLGVLWLANFLVLTLFTIAGGVVFKALTTLQNVVPITTGINYDIVQPIFPAFFFFLLCTLIAISYKIYQMLASDVDYQPGYG